MLNFAWLENRDRLFVVLLLILVVSVAFSATWNVQRFISGDASTPAADAFLFTLTNKSDEQVSVEHWIAWSTDADGNLLIPADFESADHREPVNLTVAQTEDSEMSNGIIPMGYRLGPGRDINLDLSTSREAFKQVWQSSVHRFTVRDGSGTREFELAWTEILAHDSAVTVTNRS